MIELHSHTRTKDKYSFKNGVVHIPLCSNLKTNVVHFISNMRSLFSATNTQGLTNPQRSHSLSLSLKDTKIIVTCPFMLYNKLFISVEEFQKVNTICSHIPSFQGCTGPIFALVLLEVSFSGKLHSYTCTSCMKQSNIFLLI